MDYDINLRYVYWVEIYFGSDVWDHFQVIGVNFNYHGNNIIYIAIKIIIFIEHIIISILIHALHFVVATILNFDGLPRYFVIMLLNDICNIFNITCMIIIEVISMILSPFLIIYYCIVRIICYRSYMEYVWIEPPFFIQPRPLLQYTGRREHINRIINQENINNFGRQEIDIEKGNWKIKEYEPKKECAICMTDQPKLIELQCTHEICLECIKKLQQNSCPFCRREIQTFV